jgi:phosphoglycolate phosphatase-like HAD superfamily hydrolase
VSCNVAAAHADLVAVHADCALRRPPQLTRRCRESTRDHYDDIARRQVLNPNCVEMLHALKERRLALGILTRNTDEVWLVDSHVMRW